MSFIPDLRELQKGDRFICGTDMGFNPQAQAVLSGLCFDCGRYFGNSEDKCKHVLKVRPTSNDKGNGANVCDVCKYVKKDKKRHYVMVSSDRLQIPVHYPVPVGAEEVPEEYPVAVDSVDGLNGEEIDEAQPQEADAADDEAE